MMASIVKLLIDSHTNLETISDEYKRAVDLILSPSWAVSISIDKFKPLSETVIDN